MDIKLRCNRISQSSQGTQIMTERSFVSTTVDGVQLNEEVQNASYTDMILSDTEDTSITVNDIVTMAFTNVTPAATAAAAAATAKKEGASATKAQ